MEDCYRAGDAFVFASNTETQGLVLLEALALGVPVVSTAVMGTAEVLVEGGGCLIAPEDEQTFAEQVVRVLGDPHLAGGAAAGGAGLCPILVRAGDGRPDARLLWSGHPAREWEPVTNSGAAKHPA